MTIDTSERKLDFLHYPGLSDYIACALQNLQYSESDEACMDGSAPRDTGTIYDLHSVTYDKLRANFAAFLADCASDIAAAIDYHPGNNPFAAQAVTMERIGSTYWLAQCGSGVTFTDDGDNPALHALADYARAHSVESLYLGDDGKVYLC